MEAKIDSQRYDDRDRMTDALYAQKQITETYNWFANECAAPQLRDVFMNLLNDEHQIQFDLYSEMSKRGWYSTQAADPRQIERVKQSFQKQQNQ